MVAFIIISFALAALLRGGGDGLRGVVTAGQTEKAIALAQARPSAFAAEADSAAEELQSDDVDGFHWRSLVTPLDSLPLRSPAIPPPEKTTLYHLSVTVSWVSGARKSSVTLDIQRLTPLLPCWSFHQPMRAAVRTLWPNRLKVARVGKRERGFALLIALWSVVLMALLAT